MQQGIGSSEMIPLIIFDHLNNVTQHIHLFVCVCLSLSPSLSLSLSLVLTHFVTLTSCLSNLSLCVCLCVHAHVGFQTDAAVMALAKCQLLHSSISIEPAKAGRRLLLIDYGLYS